MELERGKLYTINADCATCLNCSHDISELISGSLLIYLGLLDGKDFFLYNDPPECPQCHFFHRYHIHGMEMNVTNEFQKLLDKN